MPSLRVSVAPIETYKATVALNELIIGDMIVFNNRIHNKQSEKTVKFRTKLNRLNVDENTGKNELIEWKTTDL
jgi:hypothetical protein